MSYDNSHYKAVARPRIFFSTVPDVSPFMHIQKNMPKKLTKRWRSVVEAKLLRSSFHVLQNAIVPATRRYWLAVSVYCASNADQ